MLKSLDNIWPSETNWKSFSPLFYFLFHLVELLFYLFLRSIEDNILPFTSSCLHTVPILTISSANFPMLISLASPQYTLFEPIWVIATSGFCSKINYTICVDLTFSKTSDIFFVFSNQFEGLPLSNKFSYHRSQSPYNCCFLVFSNQFEGLPLSNKFSYHRSQSPYNCCFQLPNFRLLIC